MNNFEKYLGSVNWPRKGKEMKKDSTQWFSEKYLTIGSLEKKKGVCIDMSISLL